MTSIRFSPVGGDPAVQFVNTAPMRDGAPDERLLSFGDAVGWARFANLIDDRQAGVLAAFEGQEAAASSLSDLLALRALLEAHFGERTGLAAGLVALLDRLLGGRPGFLKMATEHSLVFDGAVDNPAHLSGRIAEVVARFAVSSQVTRVKQCASATCVLWFVDTSRNGSRHWCRMDRCGARAKASAYYRRSKAAQLPASRR